MSSGAEVGQAGNGAAMRASPIGLWNWDDPSKIARDAEIQGVITHKDPRAIAGGGALAAAVLAALSDERPLPERFCGFVAEVAGAHSPHFADSVRDVAHMVRWEPRSAIAAISRMGLEPGQSSDWPGISPFVVPSVCMAIWSFLREPEDFRAALRLALLAGGDADTTAAMTGAMSGAHLGMAGIPARLRKGILHAEVIVEIGDRLFARKFAPRERLPHLGALIRGVAKARR
jgi:ADP-ribosylglycohydrolase